MLIFLPASGLVLWPSKAPLGRGVQTAAGRFKIPEGPFQEHKGEVQAADPQAAILAETLACLVMPRTQPVCAEAAQHWVPAVVWIVFEHPNAASGPRPGPHRLGQLPAAAAHFDDARVGVLGVQREQSRSPFAAVEKCQSWASVAASARIWSRGAASAAARIACWARWSMAWSTWCWMRLKAVW